jgi:hypothetical protein
VHADGKWFDSRMPAEQSLKPGKAYHLAGVYDGDQLRLYIDGKPVNNVRVEGAIKFEGDPVTIGADTTPGGEVNTMRGWVDEVRISDTARYKAESFTPASRHATDDHTMLLLHMDRDQHGYLYDASGRKAHVTLRAPAEVRAAE